MATFPSQQLASGFHADQVETEFGELYDLHSERVFRFCLRRLENREDAADAVQDTFAKAWLALRDGCQVREPLAWLLTVAANVCASRYRASRARPAQAPLTDNAASVAPLTSSELSGLPEALRALPDEQRHVFVLRELRGCSYDEIGDAIGASQASVAGLLHRARRSLAASLSGAGKKVMVALPFPSVLRSAFEGSGAIVTATAAATAAGTLALVGPPLPDLPDLGFGGHNRTPAATAASTTGAVSWAQPLAVAWSFQPPVHHRAPSPVPPASFTRSGTPSGAAAPSAETVSAAGPTPAPTDATPPTPVAGADGPVEATPAAAPTDPPGQVGGEAPAAAVPPPAGSPSDPVAGNDHGNGVAGAKSRGNGPAIVPGSQGNGQAGAKSQGNGPPADPGSQGVGHGGQDASPAAPVDPPPNAGPQANGHANDGPNGNANGQDNGNGQAQSGQSDAVDHGAGNGGGGNPHDG